MGDSQNKTLRTRFLHRIGPKLQFHGGKRGPPPKKGGWGPCPWKPKGPFYPFLGGGPGIQFNELRDKNFPFI